MRRTSLQLDDLEVTLIGAGRSGSLIAPVLAMLGVRLRLYDPDRLGPENSGKQLYRRADIAARRVKVAVLSRQVRAFVPGARVAAHAERFGPEPGQRRTGILVFAVDTMAERRRMWQALRHDPDLVFLADVRLGPGQVRLHEVHPDRPDDVAIYEASLHEDPAAGDAACSDASTAHAAAAAAALVGGALSGFVDRIARPRWVAVDLNRAQWLAEPRPQEDEVVLVPELGGLQ